MLSCTILATDAAYGICDLHNRMPVMLALEGIKPWLASENPVIDPAIDVAVRIAPVSPMINSPRYNEPDCIEAITAQAQGRMLFGNP